MRFPERPAICSGNLLSQETTDRPLSSCSDFRTPSPRLRERWSSLEESRMTYCRSTLFAALSFSVVLSPALAQVSHVPPSNSQLASPQIEGKVDALLKQMTLDEK